MCDQILKNPFQNQSLDIEMIPMNMFSIPYGGPTIKEDVTLDSVDTTENMISKISFEPTSDICLNKNQITTSGILKISYFRSGPYQTLGGTLEFRRLFLHFKDLVLNVKVKFTYNPDTICKNSEDTKLVMIVDPEKGIDFDEYFVTDGSDITNINDLFYDLTKYFKNYSSNFGVLFDILLMSILDKSKFKKQIIDEFTRLICLEQKKEAPVSSSYTEKLVQLIRTGDIRIIIKNENNFPTLKNV